MAKIVYILDTSVPATDPRAPLILSEGNVVVIPFPLLEELDGLKSSSRDIAPYARQAIRVLDDLRSRGDLSKGVATPGGGVVIVDSKYATPSDLIIQPNTPDNIIICTAYKWLQHVRRRQSQQPKPSRPPQQRRQKGETRKRDIVDLILDRFPATDVRVVSRDFNLRVKAASCGITAEDYQHDKAVRSEDEIYSGMATIPIAAGNFKEFSRLLCQNGPAGTTLEDFDGLVAVPKLFPNQCCVFETDDNRNVLAVYKDDNAAPRFVHVPKPQQQSGRGISPRNTEQAFALALLRDPSITLVTLSGIAGGGKTLMALLAGIEAISETGPQNGLLVYRPNTEIGEKMGFLPGSLDEKFEPWKRPVIDALELLANGAELAPKDSGKSKKLFNVEAYLKQKISIEPINYIQGRSLHGKYVIVDETQNLRPGDVTAVITRIGKGAKIVLTGDIKQIANDYLDAASNGLTHVIQNMCGERLFGHITLRESERSELAELAARRL